MKFYKKIYDYFNDIFGKTLFHPQFFLKSYEHLAVDELKKNVKGTLLDIGCGRQVYKSELLTKIKKYVGVDHPQVSKKYHNKDRPEILADAEKLPLADRSYEAASMISVLEHLPHPTLALNEAWRILKPNGYLILIAPQNYPLHDIPYDFFRYTRFSLKKLLEEAGFKVKSITPIGSYPIFAGQMLNVFLLNKIKVGLSDKSHWKLFYVLLIPPVLLISFLSNIYSFILSKFISDYEKGAFAIYNLAVAKKPSVRKSSSKSR